MEIQEKTIHVGDAFPLSFTITYGGMPVTPSNIIKMEVILGRAISKVFDPMAPTAEPAITYDATSDPSRPHWVFSISQQMSFSLSPGDYNFMVRPRISGVSHETAPSQSVCLIHVVPSDFKERL